MKQCSTPEAIWARTKRDSNGCWIWQLGKDPSGYGLARYHKRTWKAHRLAYTLVHGPIANGLLVCHSCDIRACINPSHLFLGTHQDNRTDCVRKGRTGKSHLTWDTVNLIRWERVLGASYKELAERHQLSPSNMLQICTAKTWKLQGMFDAYPGVE